MHVVVEIPGLRTNL